MRLQETVFAESLTIDADAGVIRGVKVLGRESKNGRTYTDAALKEAATLYEGVDVNVDHPAPADASKPRGVADGIGWLKGVNVKSDGVYADLHYLRSHPLAEMMVERATKNPTRFGMSHNADGRVRKEGDKLIVEGIDRVFSVDLVRNPATNAGLFESEHQPPEPMKYKLTEVFAELAKREPKHAANLKPLLEMDGEMEMSAAPAEAAPTDLASAFKAACVTVLDDSSLDMAGKLAKIKEILKAEEKLSGKADEPPAEDKPADEGEKVAEQLAALAKRCDVSDLLETEGVSRAVIGAQRYKQLLESEDPAALLASWPKSVKQPGAKPRIAPLAEQEKPLPPVTDAKSFVESITG